MKGYVREYQIGDAEYIGPRLREADRREIAAASGRELLHSLLFGVAHSEILCTIVGSTGCPVGLFGIAPVGPICGIVWFLSTDDLVRSPMRIQFIREAKAWLKKLHAYRPLLTNILDERNTVHIRLLKWLGFVFINRRIWGPEDRPFLEFVRLEHVPTNSGCRSCSSDCGG